MKKEEVIEEIELRIKRLRAEIEISEEVLKRSEELRARTKELRIKDYSPYYLAGMLLWFTVGLVVLAVLSRKAPQNVTIPTNLYALMVVAFSLPLAYYFIAGGKRRETRDDLLERGRLARLVLNAFYRPLKKAVENDDREAIEILADELLRNPSLANAIERLGEGNPRVMAYGLLLYSRFQEDLEKEVEETLGRLHNKPVRALLRSLLDDPGKGYNPERPLTEGESHEV
ncbi:hypothetical protein [Thermococcus sp.]